MKKSPANLKVLASKEHTKYIYFQIKKYPYLHKRHAFHIVIISVGTMGFHYLTEVSSMYFNILCSIINYSTEITRPKNNYFIASYNFFTVKFNSKVVIGRDKIM